MTKMDTVTKRSLEVIQTQLNSMFDNNMEKLIPLSIEANFKYTKEQLMLEGRSAMMCSALVAIGALLETSEITPEKYEELVKEDGVTPQDMQDQYRKEISQYHMTTRMDVDAMASALACMLTDVLVGKKRK